MSANTESADFVIKTLKAWSAKQVAGLILNITSNLIRSTPVDTGWARSNWVPSIGTAFEGLAGARGTNDAGIQAAGQETVAGYGDFAWGDLYISNNVPYIGALNAGHSKQAPAGFVQDAILAGIAELERTAA